MTCEICGGDVVEPIKAERCKHTVHLCEACKDKCPSAKQYCYRCE